MGSLERRARQAAQEDAAVQNARAREQELARARKQEAEAEARKAELLRQLGEWSAAIGIPASDLDTIEYVPGHEDRCSSSYHGCDCSVHPYIPGIAKARFHADGIEFGAYLTEYGTFEVGVVDGAYSIHPPIPINSMADLGRALKARDELRRTRPQRRWWQL